MIIDERLRRLQAWWDKERGSKPMPDRAEIDIVDLRPWLGNLTLVDVIEPPKYFYYRVCGTNIADIFGMDFTGKTVADVDEPVRAQLLFEYQQVCNTGLPFYAERQAFQPGALSHAKRATLAVLALPLTKGGTKVAQILKGAYRVFDTAAPPRAL